MTNSEFLQALFRFILKNGSEFLTDFLYSLNLEFVKNAVSYSIIIILLHVIYYLSIEISIKVITKQETQPKK